MNDKRKVDQPNRSVDSSSPRPERPDPLAPPSNRNVKVDSDPLHKDSVRPIPSA